MAHNCNKLITSGQRIWTRGCIAGADFSLNTMNSLSSYEKQVLTNLSARYFLNENRLLYQDY